MQNMSHAVMAQRVEVPDSLDFFPTPPWATRALFEHVLPAAGNPHIGSAWEPACGAGHMAAVLLEEVAIVRATDIFDYGYGDGTVDFLDPGARLSPFPNFVITNPPFKTALDFALKAVEVANTGAALLVRTQWLEGIERYERLFRDRPPTLFAPFVERVPMVKGRWDPAASTATSYAWFVWIAEEERKPPFWIPPGCRQRLTRPGDIERFAAAPATPLLEAAE